ncbi:MAG TPA: hypothetical protein VN324_08290, partial [Quisquiliibacterium sp.]|nr:hypothetical protein [Quisquiliibacterium sp.]
WPALDDEAIIAELVEVRGIGRWTAEMFLIFNLMRPDVLPVDDLGVLRAMQQHYPQHLPETPPGNPVPGRPLRLAAAGLGERWRPWRTVATWYLWRSLEAVPVEY